MKSTILFIIMYLLTVSPLSAQEEQFLIGTFPASFPPEHDSLLYNFSLIQQLGFNAVYHRAVVNISSAGQQSNLQALSNFHTVVALNDSVPVDNLTTFADNEDWIYFATCALYSKWEAEGDDVFGSAGPVGMDPQFGGLVDGNTAWGTGISEGTTNELFFTGPNYSQYKKYVYTNIYNNNNHDRVEYVANFRLRTTVNPVDTVPVCKLLVQIRDHNNNILDTLAESIIYSDELGTEYDDFKLEYSYQNFIDTSKSYSDPGQIELIHQRDTESDHITDTLKVHFLIEWLGNYELVFDYVEVYDIKIFETWFLNPSMYNLLLNNIEAYNNMFPTESIKYFHSLDEPHSFDGYEAVRRTQHILDSLGINPHRDLITHLYPGYDNKRDGVNALEKWMALGQPKKLFFWYFPFGPNKNAAQNASALWWNQQVLQEAHNHQPGFYAALQTWGFRNLDTLDLYYDWKTPSPAELGAQTMLTLAHGARGIFFEPFYSYISYIVYNDTEKNVMVEAIVDTNLQPRNLYYKVDSINTRLNGPLGKQLAKLNYTGNYISKRDDDSATVNVNSIGFISIIPDTNSVPYNYFASSFTSNDHSDRDYFLLANIRTVDNVEKNFAYKIYSSSLSTPLRNVCIRNVEYPFTEDIVYYRTVDKNIKTVNLTLPNGEGYLYEIGGVCEMGGTLVSSETISSSLSLNGKLIIPDGVVLTVNDTYTINDTILIESGGTLKVTAGGELTLSDSSAVIANGSFIIEGSSGSKISINLSSSLNESPIIIGDSSTAHFEYCNFSGGSNGIVADGSFDSLCIIDCTFDNFSNTAISINDTGSTVPYIWRNSFQNTKSGIAAYNLESITICWNDLDCENGIFLSGVAMANILHNKLISSSAVGPGITMNSSGGHILSNTIANHTNGMIFGSSSPDVGTNTIYNCTSSGIYIGSNSQPDLQRQGIIDSAACAPNGADFRISGHNTIYNNGDEADGSEIYMVDGSILLYWGCNVIKDDRWDSTETIFKNLISRTTVGTEVVINVNAQANSWGAYDPSGRFEGQLLVLATHYCTDSCNFQTYPNCTHLLYSYDSLVIDTLIKVICIYPTETNEEEEAYSEGMTLVLNGSYDEAAAVYEQIILDYGTTERSLEAYTMLYQIERLRQSSQQAFSNRQQYFTNSISGTTDSLIISTLEQLSAQCDVGEGEFQSAIGHFENVAQNNPGTVKGVFAEIDALTVAMIPDSLSGGLSKSLSNKGVTSKTDINKRILGLLQETFGSKKEQNDETFVPDKFDLKQNYPNPFNPVTTITFDLPVTSRVLLKVYDILGREVVTLADDQRQPGRYKVEWDASGIASGVYIYTLQTESYTNSKKMMLLK